MGSIIIFLNLTSKMKPKESIDVPDLNILFTDKVSTENE